MLSDQGNETTRRRTCSRRHRSPGRRRPRTSRNESFASSIPFQERRKTNLLFLALLLLILEPVQSYSPQHRFRAFESRDLVRPHSDGTFPFLRAKQSSARQRPHLWRALSSSPWTTRLFQLSFDNDNNIQFGSETEQSGVSWGGNEEEDREMRAQHKKLVDALVHENERAVKEERRREKWGKFADATNATAIQLVLEEERRELEAQFAQKAELAAKMGVSMTILAPRDKPATTSFWDVDDVEIVPGSWKQETSSSLFKDIDTELAEEWKALMDGKNRGKKNGDALGEYSDYLAGDDYGEEDPSSILDRDDLIVGASGIKAREHMSGVRVGSAGAWTLELFPGDFVVHRKFGIGRFDRTCLKPKSKLTAEEKKLQQKRRAELLAEKLSVLRQQGVLVTRETRDEVQATFGTEEDTDLVSNPQSTVLEIVYNDGTVHVPVERAYRLSRFRAGNTRVKPKLSRIRNDAWKRAKENVETATLAMAQDVLVLYATRETLKRKPFDPMMETYVKEFETTFSFEPTLDQKKCFEDVENDMVWRKRPMDRLVCGDVGFGKTEVAIRAIFRCIANGKQAALLAPTGVLAAQHFKTVMNRMGPATKYGLAIDLLRGTTTGKTSVSGREMRERIKKGETRLIVGTHALLARGLEFNNLGLLVVDEEQRFGVNQKERLKLVYNGIDVLTLSATPIPRTLQMSLSGMRDTSIIRMPPPMRKPVMTYVTDFSTIMIKKAISDELERGGQCFYVVPRIKMLDEAAEKIRELFPGIRMIQAHGRMERNGAEENVAAFAEGNYDVLLATTVIENGVDIPAVNTIIVQDSQVFGMSTLYQLRGRVGRSDKQAYAYFLYKEQSLTEQASMRLQAIFELDQLGSGFDVANRDLEIRGAGSLLGTEQSGLAMKVGFDLYMRMLKKTVRKLRGLDLPPVFRTNILIETETTPETFRIPPTYIPDDQARQVEESNARLATSTAALVNITNSWKSVHGPIPADVQSPLKTLHLHACTRPLGIDILGLVSDGKGSYDCIMRSPGLRPRHIAMIVEKLPRKSMPKGLDVIFPARLTDSKVEEVFKSGDVIDLKRLLEDDSLSVDKEDEEWDTVDKEEAEAMKVISSAAAVKDMDEIDFEQYPRFVLKKFGSPTNAVDLLLKALLPVAKAVYEIHEAQLEDAKVAAALRQKQAAMKERDKALAEAASKKGMLEY